MMFLIRFLLSIFLALLSAATVFGVSVEPLTLDQRADRSGLIGRGTVESVSSYRDRDGFIYSEAIIRIHETFKGRFPTRFTLRYRGGEVADGGETITGMPRLRPGEERVFFLARDSHDSIHIVAGPEGAPLIEPENREKSPGGKVLHRMRQRFPSPAEGIELEETSSPEPSRVSTATSPLPQVSTADAEGLLTPPRRSILADRGEPVGYLVDADSLPNGISLAQALLAVENALDAWTDVSSVTFRYDGLESFGTAASNAGTNDGRLRIQLHDTFNAISGSTTLGIGGQSYQWASAFSAGGSGGRVEDVEFHVTTRSYVVLKHTAASLQDLDTFEAVLGHEIGHSLGLAHSSEDPDEADPELSEALMYYRAQSNSQGAVLAAWDVAAVLRVHPLETPPFGYDRIIRVVTGFSPLTNPEVNQVELRGYSLQPGAISVQLYFPSASNGSFNLSGSRLSFAPDGGFSDSAEFDPGGTSSYDSTYARFSDGSHLSPPVRVRVIQFLRDTRPSGAPDGLPDTWMQANFGSASPVPGSSGAMDDPDGDELTNLQEFLLGMDPADSNSRLTVAALTAGAMEWQARPYDVYEIYTSEDLVNWEWHRTLLPETSAGLLENPPLDGPSRFFRVERVD